MTEAMPQMIPNIVRKLRSFCEEMDEIVCRKTSVRFIAAVVEAGPTLH
jgi:hypothetical protein